MSQIKIKSNHIFDNLYSTFYIIVLTHILTKHTTQKGDSRKAELIIQVCQCNMTNISSVLLEEYQMWANTVNKNDT